MDYYAAARRQGRADAHLADRPASDLQGSIAARERHRSRGHALLGALRRCCLAGSTPADTVVITQPSHLIDLRERKEIVLPTHLLLPV